MLKPGDKAPYFRCKDINGRLIDLNDYRHQPTLLCFFRYAGCPWCNLALHRIILEYPRLAKRGLEVIAFVQSEAKNIKKNIISRHKPKPEFPIIADHKMEIYKQYHVNTSLKASFSSVRKVHQWLSASFKHKFPQSEIDGKLTLVPAQFLIGKNLKIVKVLYGTDYYDHMPLVDIYDYLLFGETNNHHK